MAKKQEAQAKEKPLTAKEEYGRYLDCMLPFPNTLWWRVPNYLWKKHAMHEAWRRGVWFVPVK